MKVGPRSVPEVDLSWPQLPQRALWRDAKVNSTAAEANPLHADSQRGEREIIPISTDDSPPVHQGGCEYLDHTADVQLHAWGQSRSEAYAAAVVGLHAYIVDAPDAVPTHITQIEARGHDEHSLLYAVLDEALFLFASDNFVISRARVDGLQDITKQSSVSIRLWGYYFQHGVHPQGTEVKAITYSNMHVVQKDDESVHLYVIVDI